MATTAGAEFDQNGEPNFALPDLPDIEPQGPSVTSIFDLDDDEGPHEYIETLGVRGNLIKARVEAIQNMAEEKPDEVLRVLRGWLSAEAEA
jgi:flagellar M-ring protein FliF